MTINLEKALLRENKRILSASELLIINEYEKHAGAEMSTSLQRIGLASTVQSGKYLKSLVDHKEAQLSKFDKKRVFHKSQIKSLCNKYRLKFLPASMYAGTIDSQLPSKVDAFEINHGVTLDTRNTFIIAPQESFKLQEHPKDPLLFYRINEDYFYLIHKWGNDLSIFRRIVAIINKPWILFVPTALFMLLFIYIFSLETEALEITGIIGMVFTFIMGNAISVTHYTEHKPFEYDSKFV